MNSGNQSTNSIPWTEDQILDTEENFKTSKKVQYKKNNWMLQKHGGVNNVTGCVIIIC